MKFATRQQCSGAPGEQLGTAGPPLVFQLPPLPTRIGQILNQIDDWTAAPTRSQMEETDELAKLLEAAAAQVRPLVEEELPALNKKMNEAGIPHIRVETGGARGGGRRPPEPGEK